MSVLLLVSCIKKAGVNPNPIINREAKQHFCHTFSELIMEERKLLGLCYKYPLIAVNVKGDWFWLQEQTLMEHMEKQALIKEERLKSYKQQLDNEIEIEDEEGYIELDPTKPIVYLTFDDGPGKYTDQVLNILKAENIKATFFILGIQAKKNPIFTKRIVEDGHTIGNHTYDHDYEKIYESFSVFAEQVVETNRIIYDLTGAKVNLFRAPGGSINNFDEGYFNAMREAGFKVFDWNIDSKDSHSRDKTKEKIIDEIKNSILHNPAIVLLHDTTTHEQSMLALPEIIEHYKALGYQFAPLTDDTPEMTFRLGSNLKWEREAVTDLHIEQFKQQIKQLYD